MSSGLYGIAGSGNRYLAGDSDPEEFDWNNVMTPDAMLTLLCRNGKIRKATSWVAREAVRPRFVLKKDKKIKGTKFGKIYIFDSILEYLEWIGFFTELEKVFTWSRLFGTSIIVMFKEGEKITEMLQPLQLYDSCSAYHPMAGGNGYAIEQDEDGKYYYKIIFVDNYNKQFTYKVHISRVIIFNAPQLELKYGGTSDVEPMAKLALMQEQMFRSVMKRIHLMGAGVAIVNANNDTEKASIESTIGDAFKYLDKIYTSIPPKEFLDIYVPDLNPQQFRVFWDIAQEEIATDINMSKKLISGDPQGQQSSAKWDTEISYTEVYQTQRHYKRVVEHVMYMFGIEDTTFMWNDPFPTESKEQTPGTQIEVTDQSNDYDKKDDKSEENKDDKNATNT